MALTEQEGETLQLFKDITNWSQSEQAAISLLQSCDWNVETAVLLHFEGVDAMPVPQSQPARSAANTASRSPVSMFNELNDVDEESIVAPSGVAAEPTVYPVTSVPSFIRTFLLAPLNFGYKVFNTIFYMISYVFPFMPRLTGYYPANRNARLAEGAIDAKSTAIRYIRWFEETYHVTLTPPESESSSSSSEKSKKSIPFFEGGYSEALDRAKKDLKYLIVYLQSDEHENTDKFNRDVLLNPMISNLLNRDDVIFWAGSVKESEAYLVSSGLEVTKFPFVGVIAPSPRTPSSNTVIMTVILKIQGCGSLSAEQFLSIVEEKLEAHAPKIMALVFDKQERESSRQILQEQNSAYERSLAQDRERERQKRELASRKAREEEELKAKEELISQWKRWKAATVKAKLEKAEKTTERTARISIRLLNSERVIKKFNADDTIEDIYAYVECHDLIEGGTDLSDAIVEQPAYVHKYDKFQLVSPMPRKVMTDLAEVIKDEPCLWPNGNLLVQEWD